MMQCGNVFYLSWTTKYFYFGRFLSTEVKKFAVQQKIALGHEFKYRKYFQDNFRKELSRTTDGLENLDLQKSYNPSSYKTKIRKPVDLRYKGEILYGIHPVYLALKQQKRQFLQLFLKNEFSVEEDFSKKGLKMEIEYLAREIGVSIQKVSTRNLNCLAPNSVHQGVCLDASVLPVLDCDGENFEKLDGECSTSPPLWLVLDAIQDPMNFGAVIRSSYFFGVDRLITVRNNSCRLSPVVSKASSGAMEVMDIFCINDLEDFIQRKKSDGWTVVSTTAYNYSPDNCSKSDQNIVELNDFSLTKPTVLILGNESKGVSSEIQSLCDALLSIHPPKNPSPCIDSLNVSVATGIILHHMKNS